MSRVWNNEPMSALTHLIGGSLSIVALVLLIIHGVKYGTALHVVTFTIFGVSMFLTYLMSTIYHFICIDRFPRAREVFRILDHSSIYFLIAGTYTPVALIALPSGWGWTLFGLVWALAVLGTVIKATQLKIPQWASVSLYLLMGWLVVIALVPLAQSLESDALTWLVLGGLFYTVGTLFFAIDHILPRTRWWGMHEVFHIFVMLGSFSHFWLLYSHLSVYA